MKKVFEIRPEDILIPNRVIRAPIFRERKLTQFPILRGILDHLLRFGKISQKSYDEIYVILNSEDDLLTAESEE